MNAPQEKTMLLFCVLMTASRYIFYTVEGTLRHCVRPLHYQKVDDQNYHIKYANIGTNQSLSKCCIWDLKVKEDNCGDINFNYENYFPVFFKDAKLTMYSEKIYTISCKIGNKKGKTNCISLERF